MAQWLLTMMFDYKHYGIIRFPFRTMLGETQRRTFIFLMKCQNTTYIKYNIDLRLYYFNRKIKLNASYSC